MSFDRAARLRPARPAGAGGQALRARRRRQPRRRPRACGSTAASAPARRRWRCSSRARRSTPGRSVAIYSLPRLLAEIRATFEADSEGSYVDFLDRLAAVDLLHVDDVGAERTSDWVLEQLYAIVNARYEDERSVIITTNLERDELVEQIRERTVSRLEEMCTLVPLYGEDARRFVA